MDFNEIASNQKLIEGNTIIVPSIDYTEPVGQSTSSGTTKPKIAIPSYVGYYFRPIDNGRRSQGIHGRNAVDLADSCGTPIMASAEGRVLIARNSGWNGGYGKYIVISHSNGTQTLYAHMSRVDTFSGADVVKGQVIGLVGTTGHSTGCHLHLEIRGAKNPF
jgi:murein DD-endopeptidase MepM/ murein hydrolase activator NlpD